MSDNSQTQLVVHGRLVFGPVMPTLSDIEYFCSEARRLGLTDNSRLFTSRQGYLGPIIGWYFDVPVQPKETNEQQAQT